MRHDLRAVMERVDAVERQAFVALYEQAPPELHAGMHAEGPVLATWLPGCDDPGFSCVFDFALAWNHEHVVERLAEVLRANNAPVLAIDTHPDFDPRINEEWFLARGFRPAYGECVWWRALVGAEFDLALPEGVHIEFAAPNDAATFTHVLNVGFGEEPDGALGRAFAARIGDPDWLHYLVFVDGKPGAASALYLQDAVADFFVASTVPSARRRGAQTALIRRRLADAQRAGCELATAQSVLDNASPRNFARHGFAPVYERMIYARSLRNGSVPQ